MIKVDYTDKGKRFFVVNKQFMKGRLNRYINWLGEYKLSWDNGNYEGFKDYEAFLKDEECHKESRGPILEMIRLLQD